MSDGECLAGVEAGAGATTMTQTNQLQGTARENPHTFASPYHGIDQITPVPLFDPTAAMASSRFEVRKQKILEQINVPDGEYHDLSPKGSIDAPIRELISEINDIDGIVTTSSCSGRISVFLEGQKAENDFTRSGEEGEESRAGPGGKGGGGTWLFISHDPVEVSDVAASQDFLSKFGLEEAAPEATKAIDVQRRFIHLKFEPMVRFIINGSYNI